MVLCLPFLFLFRKRLSRFTSFWSGQDVEAPASLLIRGLDLEGLYLNGSFKNLWAGKLFVEYVNIVVVATPTNNPMTSAPFVTPLEYQMYKLEVKEWTPSTIACDDPNYSYKSGSFFPPEYEKEFLPFSLYPYLNGPNVKAFLMFVARAGYAWSTITGIIVPTWRKLYLAFQNKSTLGTVDLAISLAYRDIRDCPSVGKKGSNSCGSEPCIVPDLLRIFDFMPPLLARVEQKKAAYALMITTGARTESVASMRGNSILSVTVSREEFFNGDLSDPIIFVNLE